MHFAPNWIYILYDVFYSYSCYYVYSCYNVFYSYSCYSLVQSKYEVGEYKFLSVGLVNFSGSCAQCDQIAACSGVMGSLLPYSLNYSMPGPPLLFQILLAAIAASPKVKLDAEF